ncbi:LamG-like jellyroll fold domain-containing protein, partial [Methanocrinis sp.]|uniref:LamG-like jellyroll fold domain-containing protein n=1 Tax=Methanocrinis sp. TaxID=3101522 RepID=UPI003D0A4C72
MSIGDHVTIRESLERLKEAHPELDSITKILSRYPLSEDGEEGFIRDFAGELDGGFREARQVYRMAANIQEKAALIWANISDAASPHFNQALFNNLPDDFLQQLQSIPGYNRLFGSLDYLECDHSRSIFGPAAYFVDLMRFVETNITSKNKITPECEDGVPPECELEYRRPDLYKMQLSYSNTYDQIPYIDLVNELLEVFIKTEDTAERDAYELVEDAVFPMSLPFNLPLEEIRSYLKQLGTGLYQIYKAFDNLNDANTKSLTAREFLELSPKEFSLILSEISSPSDVSKYYGDLPLAGETGLENVDLFLEKTNLTKRELNELIFQDLDRHELNAGLSRLFFVNNVDDGLGAMGIFQDDEGGYEKLLNLSPKKLDRIYRFVKLSRKLGWSFTDLDWSLRSLQEPYLPEKMMIFDGINDYVTCPDSKNLNLTTFQAFTVEAWINPAHSGRNAVVGALMSCDDHQFHFFFGLDPSNELIFRVRKSTEEEPEFNTEFELTSDRLIPLGVFTHVALSVGDGRASLYINGQLDNEAVIGAPIDSATPAQVELNIGKDLYDEYFEGCIKDVRIWRSARDQAAIEYNVYGRFTGRENGLVGYWPLTEWSTLFDLTPNGNDGIMGGEEFVRIVGGGGFVTRPKWVSRDLILDPLPERGDGKGYRFNGKDQYLAAREVEFGEIDQMTLEAWVNVESGESGLSHNNYIISFGGGFQNQKFALWVDTAGKFTFVIGTQQYKSSQPITLDQLTHVCIVQNAGAFTLYINGISDNLSAASSVNLVLQEHNLNIGRSPDDEYFNGIIKEVRLWNKARDQDQIALYMYRPVPPGDAGLIGRWPLDEVEDGMARDLSYSQNHLYLGGIPEDYMPERRTTARLPEPESLPIPLDGTALQFDGDNDVIVICNPKNWGLGKYDRLTLELWFNALDEGRSDERQVIFSQGDVEAGLNIYLYNNQLHVLIWKNNYEGKQLQRYIFKESIEYGEWHHIAVTKDEFPSPSPVLPDNLKFEAYLNGAALNAENDSDVAEYRLSPVGPAYLGGLGQGGVTCFEEVVTSAGDAYSIPESEHLYFFAGQVADLRLWKTAKTAADIGGDRHFAPGITEDMVAYFPMDEGEGWLVGDRAGELHDNKHVGALQKRNIALITEITDPELVNFYSHYADPVALEWKDYLYAGRMRITEENSAVGITILSRHPENVDQYYRLGWDQVNPTFHLVAHPLGVQAVHGEIDSNVILQANTWYRFLIQVEDEDSRTNIRAKVWPEAETEPAEFQIDAYDDSDIRIVSGTVGLWTSGASAGSRQFDNLRVWPASIADPKPSDLLLDINFEAKSQVPEPEKWSDTADRLKPVVDEGLFGRIEVDGSEDIALGTDSTDENIHSHYNPADVDADVLGWKDYVYQGKMRISDPEGGIGVTFLSRYPEGIDQYYALRRDAEDRTFHLVAHPHGVQSVESSDPAADKTDSGVEPEPNTWYRFLIEVEDAGSRTEVRAKVWPDNEREPAKFQIEAHDESSIRIKSGTVGVWASDAGSKYFDDLRVYREVLFSENFDTYSANQDPECWRDTKAGYSNEEDDAIFKTFEIDGDKVFGTGFIKNYVHSHYVGADARDWNRYAYTGKMRITDLSGGIGVTFFSQYFKDVKNYKRYYRLGYNPYGPSDDPSDPMMHSFYLSPHPPYVMPPIKGRYLSELSPEPDIWYRFLIEVERTGAQTNIRAKIWPESEAEPSEFQIEAYDDGDDRPAGGTVGVWAYGRGSKYFDDLEVVGEVLLSEMFVSGDWKEIGSRDRHEEDESLFETVDTLNNDLRWKAVEDDYPVLLRPLCQMALRFDGQRRYLAAEAEGLELCQLTAEAWINLSRIKECPILSLGEGLDGSDTGLIFGIDGLGHLRLQRGSRYESAGGTVSVGVGEYVHVAVWLEGGKVTFFVNGEAEEIALSQSYPLSLKIDDMEIGRDFDGHYFEGEIKEVRIWKTARSSDEISSWIYQRPFASDDLVGYWSLGEEEGAAATDASTNKNHMRLGGLESSRRPVLVDLDEPDRGFWRPERKVLDFDGVSHIVIFNDVDAGEGSVCQRRAVEVWFWVEDKTISHRKQVIYQEGDDERGLNIYVYDGSLYLGGYNINESQWEGTWLHTDRIESCRWHHVALVLDGRGEVRDDSLQAFMDGKFVDEGPASQLWEHKNSFRLGGAIDQFRFHDGEVYDAEAETPPDHHFRGQILDLRVWKTIRTLGQIQESLYSQPTDDSSLKDKPGLYLWWQFDEAAGNQIPDLSGNDHVAAFATGQIKAIQLPPEYRLPSTSLDADVLDGIAAIKGLKEGHRWSVDRLCALWNSIKHFGKEDQAVLFDEVFNPEGSAIERLDYYLDQPIRWDKTGEEDRERDRKIRSRLMGALRVSTDDLNAIVEHLSGEVEEIIELDHLYLDHLYLDQMYRLAQLAGILHLGVSDLLELLSLVDKSTPDTPQEVVVLEEFVQWMKSSGLKVADLVFITHDPDDLGGSVSFFEEGDVCEAADDLIDQAGGLLIKGDSFKTDHISQAESVDVFDFLLKEGLINEIVDEKGDVIGATVTSNSSETVDFEGLLKVLAEGHNWIGEFDILKSEFDQIRLQLGEEIIALLIDHSFINSDGLVLDKEEGYGSESLEAILEDASYSQNILDKIEEKLPRITEVLELRKSIQDEILSREGPVHAALQKARDDQKNAVVSGVAGLFDVQPDLTLAVFDYFRDKGGMDASKLLIELNDVHESRSISDALAAYLAKFSKVLHLADLLGLAVAEVEALLEDPEIFGLSDVLRPTLQELHDLFGFKKLQAAFEDAEGKLIELLRLEADDFDAVLKSIDDLAGWEPRQVNSLVKHLRHNQIRAAFDDAEGKLTLLVCLKADDIDAALKEIDDLACWEPDEGDLAELRAVGDDTDDDLILIHLISSEAEDIDAALKEIDDLTCWEPLQIIFPDRHFDLVRYNRIADLSRMKTCFDLARSLLVDIDFMIQLADTSLLDTDEEFGFYSQKAALLLEVLRAKYTDEEWPKVYKPIRDQLAVQRRDALLSLAMLKLKLDPEYEGRKDPDIFHQYFLLDFQVGSEVDTSRIVQGTASLQLYVQRCLMNLERGVDPATIPTEEWEWVKNYRVWEANRKVFLYPENYIEPDLRDTKTPIFEELEQELLQSEITQESAEAAFNHYLEKFAEVADLKIVGSYLHTDVTDVRSANPAERDEVLYLVGRTNTDPRIYYLREHVKDQFGGRWLPWKKIDLVINSDFATPVYAFGKLFLFWTEFTKLTKSVDRKLSEHILNAHGVPALSEMLIVCGNGFRIINSIEKKLSESGFNVAAAYPVFSALKEYPSFLINTYNLSSVFADSLCFELAGLIDKINSPSIQILLTKYSSREELQKQNNWVDFIVVLYTVKELLHPFGTKYDDMLAELGDRDISNLEEWTWVIDQEGYLYSTKIDQRVQEPVDFYNTAVKYSYLNFSNGWAPPQNYAELDNELRVEMYRKSRWQRVYAQQVLELAPEEIGQQQPEEEKNAEVLEIDEFTKLNKVVPFADMSNLTCEFWTKFLNKNPLEGW